MNLRGSMRRDDQAAATPRARPMQIDLHNAAITPPLLRSLSLSGPSGTLCVVDSTAKYPPEVTAYLFMATMQDTRWINTAPMLFVPVVDAQAFPVLEFALANRVPLVALDSPNARDVLASAALYLAPERGWPGLVELMQWLRTDHVEREAQLRRGLAQSRRLRRQGSPFTAVSTVIPAEPEPPAGTVQVATERLAISVLRAGRRIGVLTGFTWPEVLDSLASFPLDMAFVVGNVPVNGLERRWPQLRITSFPGRLFFKPGTRLRVRSSLTSSRDTGEYPSSTARSRWTEETDPRFLLRALTTPTTPARLPPPESPEQTPEWVTAIGAWGDTMAACGNALQLLQSTGGDQVGIVHYGFDPFIVEFLRAQPWVREARQVLPESQEDYRAIVTRACQTPVPWREGLAPIFNRADIDPNAAWPTHVDFAIQTNSIVINRWRRAELPLYARHWAAGLRSGSERRLYLLHPVSTQSSPRWTHWPHWHEAVQWLLKETPHRYVLTGDTSLEREYPAHPRLIDLMGKTESMLQVLALADQCDGLITTSNSLSMWSLIQDIPNVVCCNSLSLYPNNYFKVWIDAPRNRLVGRHGTLDDFRIAVSAMLENGR